MRIARPAAFGALAALLLAVGAARGQERAPEGAAPARTLVDRCVLRWFSPETGGPSRPQFVFERELRFRARLEALADPDADGSVFRERHVRAALDRLVAESLLANLAVVPAPSTKDLSIRAATARTLLQHRVRGAGRLAAAAAAEGIAPGEIDLMLRRSARASIYLERMVAPTLMCSEAELRALHRTGVTPFDEQTFEDAAPGLQRWCDGARLAQAVDAYYQDARPRITFIIMDRRSAGSAPPTR